METIKKKVADVLIKRTIEVKNEFQAIITDLEKVSDRYEYEEELEFAKYRLRGIFWLAISYCYIRQGIYKVKVDGEAIWFVDGWFLLPNGLMFNRLEVINLWFEDIKTMFSGGASHSG